MANEQKVEQPPPTRPSLHSQHSNSVPSTPYQKPLNFRFHSRSPSPSRHLSSQSPQSIASEAVGNAGPQHRNVPVLCKFETGDEIRKRRIPYVDGGNEELKPPTKEPKKSLDLDEEAKLSGDMRELYDRLLPSEESEERRARLVQKLDRILNEEWPGNDIRVKVFGSSGNLLSSTDSDVDICITTALKRLESMHSLAALLHRHGMEKVVCRAAAKVPIVKCWDPELQLAADLNVNNPLALQNTRMIKTYVQLDLRVRPLAKIIKYWTKQRILNDAAFGGTISSYTWICMVISFLQRRDPPILPSLQTMPSNHRRKKSNSGELPTFADDVDAIKGFGDANKESLGELLFQFFRHYGYEFEYSKYVVSIKEGRLLSREEKGWEPSNYHDKEARNRLCVEEPFTIIRNLGNSADDYAWHGIHGEIRRAFDLLADGCQLDKCCEQYEFPQEDKPIFQKPAPKPKPILTRSASQSSRPNQDTSTSRSRKQSNRNTSSQRPGNRRASSGATFSNQRIALPFGPLPGNAVDYLSSKSNLHEQLYQQYQYLQAQQDALRSQLAQQTQAHAQAKAQARVGDLAGAPLIRASTNGLPSPRIGEFPAPLPSYLYHYPSRYPGPATTSQSRSREGTSTNPSSPSLTAAVPSLRRQGQRTPVPDAPTTSGRSQSQPGRSLPHPLALQQQAHPGYDVSGTWGPQYLNLAPQSQFHYHGQSGLSLPFSPSAIPQPTSQPVEGVMPKEYVGYYVGQSPQLRPQYLASSQIPLTPMALKDLPQPYQRPRRVTPDFFSRTANGMHSSRSQSPHGRIRSYSNLTDIEPIPAPIVSSVPSYDHSGLTPVSAPASRTDFGGPLIVNGSGRSGAARPLERANFDLEAPTYPLRDTASEMREEEIVARPTRPLPIRTNFGRRSSPDQHEAIQGPTPSSSDVTPPSSPRGKKGPRHNFLANGSPQLVQDLENFPDAMPLTASLLSPVAELRTPSPAQQRRYDSLESSPANGSLQKAAKVGNLPLRDQLAENQLPTLNTKHERNDSAPALSATGKPSSSPRSATAHGAKAGNLNDNPWQQATRKGHKKNKSGSNPKSPLGPTGQPLSANEMEPRGG